MEEILQQQTDKQAGKTAQTDNTAQADDKQPSPGADTDKQDGVPQDTADATFEQLCAAYSSVQNYAESGSHMVHLYTEVNDRSELEKQYKAADKPDKPRTTHHASTLCQRTITWS